MSPKFFVLRTSVSRLSLCGNNWRLIARVVRSSSMGGVSGSFASREVGGVATAVVPNSHGAWLYHEYGPVKDVLKFEEIAVLEVKPDQVLVKAAAINPVDYNLSRLTVSNCACVRLRGCGGETGRRSFKVQSG